MAELSAGGVTLNINPKVNWSLLHGELTQALFDEAKHFLACVLGRDCPVCK